MTLRKNRLAAFGGATGAVIGLGALLAVAAGFFAPTVVALLRVGLAGEGAGSFPVARILSALRFTLVESFLSAILAVAVGLPAAFFTARRDFPGRRFLLALSAVPLCVPPMIIALAFVLYYGRQGWVNLAFMRVFGLESPPLTFLYSMTGVVFAHGLYNFPVVMRTVSRVWERLPLDVEEAASLLGAGPFRVFATITLPRLARPVLSAAALVFLYCFFSFMIVLLFGGVGGTTLEVELYHSARSALDFRSASLVAGVETAAAFAIIGLYAWLQRGLGSGTSSRDAARARVRISGFRETAAASIVLGSIALFFIGPLLSIPLRSVVSSASGARYGGTLELTLAPWFSFFGRGEVLPALASTLATGMASAALATLAALAFAFFSYGREVSPLLSRAFPLLPLAVSPVMLGFGWTLLLPRGGWPMLVVAQAALAWPFAWAQVQSALERVPQSVHDAARMLSTGPLDRFYRVLAPLASRGVLSGAALVFAISAGDATLPLVLSVPGYENLSLLLFRLAGSYRFPEACVCAVLLSCVAGFAFFVQDGDSRGN